MRGGITISFGSHLREFGLMFSGYGFYQNVQLNTLGRITWYSRHIGPPGRGREIQLGIGGVVAIDPYDRLYNPFHSVVGNQTGKRYSIGYGHNFYWDTQHTSQQTGIIGLQIGHYEFAHENDIFSTVSSDRYRTAALSIYYFNGFDRIGINSTMLTGNTNSKKTKKIRDKETGFSRYGYLDLSDSEYGNVSIGLLSVQWNRYFEYGQTSRLNIGIDSDHVRNIIQNKFFHDMYFVPQAINKAQNLHVPMIDENGNPYLYKDEQKVRADKFYYQISLNRPGYY